MKKYILLLVFVCSNIGYTQTLTPKQDLYDSLISGSFRDNFDFLTFTRPIAFVALSYDTTDVIYVSSFYILLNDVRTDYPYDYYLQFQLPSRKTKNVLNRYIEFVGFIWKMDKNWVWVIEINLQSTGVFKGISRGRLRREKFDYMIAHSLYYDKQRSSNIERN